MGGSDRRTKYKVLMAPDYCFYFEEEDFHEIETSGKTNGLSCLVEMGGRTRQIKSK